MSIRNFGKLFDPGSVAVIGASQRPGRPGTVVLNHMAEGGYAGALWPVNPKYDSLLGIACYGSVEQLPQAPDLAVICTPPATVPDLIAQLGKRGTRAAVVLTPGLERETRWEGTTLHQAMLDAAKPHVLRILGPGGVGLLAPASGLNASLAPSRLPMGRIALLSESDAVMTAALDWAHLHDVGFSKCVSLGERGDIDLGDLLDYLADDDETGAILMYVESVVCARKFMTAGRIASRAKPVIVLKPGGGPGDDVYDAAFRRAGMLRVHATEDLFDAVETLGRAKPLRGEKLAVLSNGAALARIAAGAVAQADGKLAGDPVILDMDAPPETCAAALQALLAPAGAALAPDAVLLVFAPSQGVDAAAVAQALVAPVQASGKNVLSCWLGGETMAPARQVLAQAGLPTYDTPEQAVHGFMQLVQYRRSQDQLNQVPGALPRASRPEREAAHALVLQAIKEGRTVLDGADACAVLAAYGIAVADPGAGPGMRLARALAHELAITVETDPMFGPVIRFGRGGAAAELVAGLEDEQAVGLPPLNMVLARELVERTRVARALAGVRNGPRLRPAADIDALCHVLIQVSDLVADTAELVSLTLDPLLADAQGVLALQASLQLGAPRAGHAQAIRPYPQELEQEIQWQGAPLVLRPIRPEDTPQHREFFAQLQPEDVRLRFFSPIRELHPNQLARLTQIDYDRAMAFIASRSMPDGNPETLGVVRAVADPDNRKAEFAILVRSDLKGMGLGAILFQKLVDYFRGRGTAELVGEALSENSGIQQLVRRFGGTVSPSLEPGMADLRIKLQDP
ncbi:GNAT family N-acetyltransferase [Pseudoduganella ginsengisoli]|uniref:GNAT family N-acetyltransferase n=1 Tax=Pseudoduganella ginsengisoli TaxID=1462440 RepID=A0A6L6PYP1_9BURK|nr:GNAT family N-acetyltransferase [Pseudoduganella ginsengisoli]MTW02376.1 GNAT family N-acetyltransferase [Pseudoduganella ginsengisoli]